MALFIEKHANYEANSENNVARFKSNKSKSRTLTFKEYPSDYPLPRALNITFNIDYSQTKNGAPSSV